MSVDDVYGPNITRRRLDEDGFVPSTISDIIPSSRSTQEHILQPARASEGLPKPDTGFTRPQIGTLLRRTIVRGTPEQAAGSEQLNSHRGLTPSTSTPRPMPNSVHRVASTPFLPGSRQSSVLPQAGPEATDSILRDPIVALPDRDRTLDHVKFTSAEISELFTQYVESIAIDCKHTDHIIASMTSIYQVFLFQSRSSFFHLSIATTKARCCSGQLLRSLRER